MQTKKRAKPVKFGSKDKEEEKTPHPQHATAEPAPDEIKAETQEGDTIAEDIPEKDNVTPHHGAHGLEAHITSTTQTIDIREITDDTPLDEIVVPNPISEEPKESKEPIEQVAAVEAEVDKEDKESIESEEKDEEVGEASVEQQVETVESEEKNEDEEVKVDEEVATDEEVVEKEDFFNAPPDDYDNKKSMFPYFIRVMIITFIIGLVFFAGIYYAVTNKAVLFPSSKKPTAEITETPVVAVPTKKPVDLSLYTIQVLNGTSTSGVAAKARDQLTAEGFKVGTVGNAKANDFEKTEIAANDKVDKDFLDKLKEVLSKTYSVATITTIASGSSDVVVTIGSAPAK